MLPRKKIHREFKPTLLYHDGRKEWWLNGQLHRVDGPAVCRIVDIPDMTDEEIEIFVLKGYVKRYEWWYKNKKYTKEEYIKKVQEYKQEIKEIITEANVNPIIACIISYYMTY